MKKIFALITAFIILSISVSAMEIEFKIEPQFDICSDFCRGAALVRNSGGETAVINRNGDFIIDFSPFYKQVRNNGLIMQVNEEDKAAFFNNKGEAVTDYIYDVFVHVNPKVPHGKSYYFPFRKHNDGDGKTDLIPVIRNKKTGYINSRGEEVIAPTLEYGYGFYGGVAVICSEGRLSEYGTYMNAKYGLINQNGEIIVPANACWDISCYNTEYRTGYRGEVLYYLNFIDGADKFLTADMRFVEESNISALGVRHILRRGEDSSPYVTDAGGGVIFPAGMYPDIKLFGNNFIVGGIAIVNRNNEKLFDMSEMIASLGQSYGNLYIDSMDDNFAQIRIPANDGIYGHTYTGLVNSEGSVILPPEYDYIYDMGEGIIYAKTDSENFIFDYGGELIAKLGGRLEGDFVDGTAVFLDFDTMKKGYIKNPLTYPKVYVNGEKIKSDADAKIYGSRTLIPMRAIFEALGAEIEWSDSERAVTAVKGDVHIVVAIDSDIMYKNGEKIMLDAPARIENDRTLIPLRAVSEALGCEVLWDEKLREINING